MDTVYYIKNTDNETLQDVDRKELQEVVDADVVIILKTQGKETHVELGMALALQKKVFIWHENDKYFKCTDDTLPFLLAAKCYTCELRNRKGVSV